MVTVHRCLELLRDWARASEARWCDLPGAAGRGCYGTGYNDWGVQTNQKYLAALAVLAAHGHQVDGVDPEWAAHRAVAALRFSLDSHVTGPTTCTDGTQWGHTWVSGLGTERMMHGVALLDPWLEDGDREALRRMMTSEADWLLDQYAIVADPWNHTGRNRPESNLWNGAHLWRTAVMYPEHSHAGDWREKAERFLFNAVSVPADVGDPRFVGANFFPHYALDHHGYLNVGYMVICLSNAALLHFDLQAAGRPRPDMLDHHQEDLWRVVKRLVFSDGRLARVGGDTRIRYAYCQEYLLPALLYAADRWKDPHALDLASAQLAMIEKEAAHCGDGSFYSKRLATLARESPYYYTRLESDRACVLGFAVAHLTRLKTPRAKVPFEEAVAGTWCDREHGVVVHRCPTRLASFAWRAFGLAQGMCQPPDDGHLAEWLYNLCGRVRFAGDPGVIEGGQTNHRSLVRYTLQTFEGGFVTCGTIVEGINLELAEGWRGTDSALHHIAFAALPDGHTVVGLQLCRAGPRRVDTGEIKGLHLNLPNDLFNDFRRSIVSARGEWELNAPAGAEERIPLGRWVNLNGRLGVTGLYGAEELAIHRSPGRRGGKYQSLHVEEICYPCRTETLSFHAGDVIFDIGWAVLSGVSAERTCRVSSERLLPECPGMRGLVLTGQDDHRYLVAANFGEDEQVVSPPASRPLVLAPGEARVARL